VCVRGRYATVGYGVSKCQGGETPCGIRRVNPAATPFPNGGTIVELASGAGEQRRLSGVRGCRWSMLRAE